MLEKIKGALRWADDIAISEDIDCYDVLNAIEDLEGEIRQLTAEKEVAETDRANIERTLEECNEALADAPKETAQNIYSELIRHIERDVGIGGVYMVETVEWDMVKEVFKKYGVEVDK